MRKKQFKGKLTLNKTTVVNLNLAEMKDSRAGLQRTQVGVSCETGACCVTQPVQCNPEAEKYTGKMCTFLCSEFVCLM